MWILFIFILQNTVATFFIPKFSVNLHETWLKQVWGSSGSLGAQESRMSFLSHLCSRKTWILSWNLISARFSIICPWNEFNSNFGGLHPLLSHQLVQPTMQCELVNEGKNCKLPMFIVSTLFENFNTQMKF